MHKDHSPPLLNCVVTAHCYFSYFNFARSFELEFFDGPLMKLVATKLFFEKTFYYFYRVIYLIFSRKQILFNLVIEMYNYFVSYLYEWRLLIGRLIPALNDLLVPNLGVAMCGVVQVLEAAVHVQLMLQLVLLLAILAQYRVSYRHGSLEHWVYMYTQII